MKIEFKIKVDLTEAILKSDTDEFNNFTKSDWKKHITTELQEKLDEIEMDCGAIFYLTIKS